MIVSYALWGLSMQRFLSKILVILAFSLLGHYDVVADTYSKVADNTVLTLTQAIDSALAGNPGLAEVKARAQAMAAIPSQVGSLPDPAVSFELLNLTTQNFDLRKVDMTMMGAGVSQAFPFPGKLALREKIAEHEALAAVDSIDEARLLLIREVKASWWRLFYYNHALILLAEAEHFFEQLIDIAQTQYKVGKGTQQDVLLVQMELSNLKNEKYELISLNHSQTARINALLDRVPETPLQIPVHIDFKLPDIIEAELQNKAAQLRPLFAQHRKMQEAARANVDLAKKDFYPDFTVSAGYAVRQNTPTGQYRSDFASVQLSMTVPIYADKKQAKAVDQRQSELLQEHYSLEDEHHKIQADIASKVAEYHHAKEKLVLLENEMIPQAQQTVNSLLASYQVSQTRFSDLIRTELTYFQYQNQYWQTLTNTQQLLAELSAAVGEDLNHD